ncbi:MAG: phosphoribosylanthranilate isomerase [Candidatus Bathyarchaeia archaeon]
MKKKLENWCQVVKTVRVKICGITNEKDLKAVIDAGADAIGFVIGVPSSSRNITVDKAERLFSKVPVFVETVAVTVPESLDWLLKLDRVLSPDVFQIHGEKIPLKEIRKKLMKPKLVKAVNAKNEKLSLDLNDIKTCDAILLDSFSEGKYGGTGRAHNWEVSCKFKEKFHPKPLILAGGLTPENVAEAISIVKPYAVDVSTGVEKSPGVKDPYKIFKFIKNVRDASL